MKRRATFEGAGWDFEEIWGIFENMSYPFLQPAEDTVTVRGRVGTAVNFNFGGFTQHSGFTLMLSEIPVIALNEAGLEIGRTYTDDQGHFLLNLTSLLPHEKNTLRAELREKNGIFTVRSQRGYANEVVYLERKSLSGSQRHVAMVFEYGFVYAAEAMTTEQKDIIRDAAVYYAFTHQAAQYARVRFFSNRTAWRIPLQLCVYWHTWFLSLDPLDPFDDCPEIQPATDRVRTGRSVLLGDCPEILPGYRLLSG